MLKHLPFFWLWLKCPEEGHLRGKGLFWLTVLGGYSPSWRGRNNSRQGRLGGKSKRLAGHAASTSRKQKKEERERRGGKKTSSPAAVTQFSHKVPTFKDSTSFSTSPTNWKPGVQTYEPVKMFYFRSTAGQHHEGPLKRNISFHAYWECLKCTDDVWMHMCTVKWLLHLRKWVQPLLYIQVTMSVCAFAKVWYDVFICYLSKALRLLLNLNYYEQCRRAAVSVRCLKYMEDLTHL